MPWDMLQDGLLLGENDVFFFFKQKTAYEIDRCDWSSDVCSSGLFNITSLFDFRSILKFRVPAPLL